MPKCEKCGGLARQETSYSSIRVLDYMRCLNCGDYKFIGTLPEVELRKLPPKRKPYTKKLKVQQAEITEDITVVKPPLFVVPTFEELQDVKRRADFKQEILLVAKKMFAGGTLSW